MTKERKDVEGRIEKWATRLLEINAEKRKIFDRREGIKKGNIQREDAKAGLVHDDPQALERLKHISKEASELDVKYTNLTVARNEAQRLLDEAKKELARFEYPEVKAQGKDWKNRFFKWLKEGDKMFEELSGLMNKAREVANSSGQVVPFDALNHAFFAERYDEIKDWADEAIILN